jgi:hypothetical protein
MTRQHKCEVCGRKEGDTEHDVGGSAETGSKTPLGPVTRCLDCHLWSCPDCQHEQSCCEMLERRTPEGEAPLFAGQESDHD